MYKVRFLLELSLENGETAKRGDGSYKYSSSPQSFVSKDLFRTRANSATLT
jgi:hypothetical protein